MSPRPGFPVRSFSPGGSHGPGHFGTAGLGWAQSASDVRLELHPVLFGLHAAVDPLAIVDFVLGIFTIDISDDDI